MKHEYIERIDLLMADCQDIAMLDFIFQLLIKSKGATS